jgi:DNA polymerase-3 subunit epsilon
MILFFDTETTGLPDRRMPVEWEGQPRLVQLAALLMEDDGTERASMSVIIKPDGWTIPDGAAKVHGITTEIAERVGVPAETALRLFMDLRMHAKTLCAHNIKFDAEIMRIALSRASMAHNSPPPVTLFCTMETASPIVALPPTERMRAAGFDKNKPPSLGECIRHFFNEELTGAHDALVDVRACARVYFQIMKMLPA